MTLIEFNSEKITVLFKIESINETNLNYNKNEMNKIADAVCNSNTSFDKKTIRDGAKDFYELEITLATYKAVYKKVLG